MNLMIKACNVLPKTHTKHNDAESGVYSYQIIMRGASFYPLLNKQLYQLSEKKRNIFV